MDDERAPLDAIMVLLMVGSLALAVAWGFWPLAVFGVGMYALTSKGADLSQDLIETSPPGDGCALGGAMLTGVLLLIVGLLAIVAMMGMMEPIP